jgi:hypothetical protein
VDVADPRDARGCLPSISSREASTEPKPLYPVSGEGGGVFTEMSVSPQTSPLSARHIAGVTLAQNPLSGPLLVEAHLAPSLY